ncbi:gliding motility-associated C-terminal domain-containing protein [Confluentibacter sediminis]|uniref:T9SS type B sorting domain-containing protein n=1 Tax=Confluentibacter sediminis TaxID=2219045 RepID=UPI000DAF2D6D|nr:gliding motility-associated C-terminal domain-containing protein [Confluentibacter sediminis]
MKQKLLGKQFLMLFFLSPLWLFSQTTIFNHTGAMESYTVPAGVSKINITAFGAQGASGDTGYVGGKGAKMSGDFDVNPGDVIIIAVGGKGQGQSSESNGGGGGGSFVVISDPTSPYVISAGPFSGTAVTPLVIAGGGGGTRVVVLQNGNPGVTTLLGTTGSIDVETGGGTPNAAVEGDGGFAPSESWGSGGGGFIGNGANDYIYGIGGSSFLNGAAGGTGGDPEAGDNAAGGFGGGGQGRGYYGGGGGGGYTGGDSGRVAGGGGSFNTGNNQVNESGFQSGDGQVVITVLCEPLIISPVDTVVCSGTLITLSAISNHGGTVTWDNDITNGTPFTIYTTTTFTASSSSIDDCDTEITINVSAPTVTVTSQTDVTCNGESSGAAAVNVTDGTAPYTYLWDNGATTALITGLSAGTYKVTVTDAIGCTATVSATITEPTALVASSVDANVSCNGESNGSATASATGGTAPYTYLWDNGATTASITGLSAGTYKVTVTDDNGCTATASATITEPTILVASSIVDANVSCNGESNGSATASATGGTAPYTYSWDNGATTASIMGLSGGTYKVTVTDDNGCTAISSVTITEPTTALVASSVVNANVSCSGSDGSATASATGGTAPYTYSWDNDATTATITEVEAGTYICTIMDANGCTQTTSVEIILLDKTPPTVVIQDIVVQLDEIGAATIVPSQIDNGSTDNCSIKTMTLDKDTFTCDDLGVNTVTLTVTDFSGNSNTATAIITVEDNIAPKIIAKDVTITLDDTGLVSVTAEEFIDESYDNCSISSLSIDQTNFDCANLGTYTITLTATDLSGNTTTEKAILTLTGLDTDGDLIADSCDDDDDNDGILDSDDYFPKDNTPLLVPAQAFTPNGDGINDSWVIPGIDNYPNSVVRVYNRWGHEVFATNGYKNNWNGTFKSNSEKLPSGSYLYVIDLGTGSAPLQGWIFINY